ncbi:MAG: neutral/alkaline non-lysosomal ceramidase N-terminal domain-containing protein, partial [Myxococcales bacterium]|nr:neutral/alkaline non-lysosomal ceramidase N-terminal domain-containing protein [Myxococcales bacterium]
LLIGLAGEYMSYFVTPQEYALQHYEGGSTMWGQYAGSLIVDRYGALSASVAADDLTVPSESAGLEALDVPGLHRHFAMGPRRHERRGLRHLDERLHQQLQIDTPMAQLPRLEFETEAPRWSTPTWPEVAVEVRSAEGAWLPLLREDGRPVDHRGEEFVLFPLEAERDRWRWAIWWIEAAPAGQTLRLRAIGPDGSEHCSPAFAAGEVPTVAAVACAEHVQVSVRAEDGLGIVPARP